MELKLVNTAKIAGDVALETGKELLGKVDNGLSQGLRTATATGVDLLNGESTLANVGAKVAGIGLVGKFGTALIEGALSAVNLDVSLDFAHGACDLAIGGGVVAMGAGALATGYSNRNITDEQLVALGKKNAVTATPSDKEEIIDAVV